jgi:RNA binding exosome subunit
MYIRFSKQSLVKKILSLEEKDPIRITIYTPTYVKKEIPDTYRKLLNQNND